MSLPPQRRRATFVLVLAALLAAGDLATAQTAPRTVQPGAPGEVGRTLDAADVAALTRAGHSEADVEFMQGMILHHVQALEMTALVPERSARHDVRLLARRIEMSQEDEIALMERWLAARGQEVHDHRTASRPAHHHGPDLMPGMLTAEQMGQLEQAIGAEFDRLFLAFMILHHEGALIMVEELFASEGGGQEPTVFQFASHVDADQRAEIARMRAMLQNSPQPDTE